MNIFKFTGENDNSVVVVAENVGDAAKRVEFEWKNVRYLYKNVIVVK